MKKAIMMICMLVLTLNVSGQTTREEIRKDRRVSGGSFLAYPGPQQERLTPAPGGKKPFYISHYGRHGSRHMTKYDDFKYVRNALELASQQHVLTPLGYDVLARVARMEEESHESLGELTALGARQHGQIAERMYHRFPEVFKGVTNIEAKSSTSIRSIMSMNYALIALKGLNPRLNIIEKAALRDMHHLFHVDRELTAKSTSKENRKVYDDFCSKYPTWQRLVSLLITDTAFVNRNFVGERFGYYMFRIASALQDSDLHDEMTFYDLFTEDEIYKNWKKENAFWYLGYSFCPTSGGEQPYSQRFLLRDIIEKADSCLQQPHPGITLRYGHDTALLPLICLLGINGYDLATTDLDLLEEKGWLDYRAIPMAGNLQIVFYRKNLSDKDVLIKVLLNENEATLPIKTDVAPYYHWQDFRNHYLSLIDAYDAAHSDE